eukprot:NODE_1481_length_1129_cov_512.561453.p2 GENE.NODE_1481_length_1129_cov_512.561453~~NODE_1481_length_1129_cov_512.561453.p2  ORF type:complete len:253 (+),score=64.50 NODE_1481_length_1129_cov_512.561453:3-761(+)
MGRGRIATGGREGRVLIHDVGAAPARKLPALSRGICSLSWCPGTAGRLAGCGCDGIVRVWDLSVRVPTQPTALEAHVGPVHAVAWSPHDSAFLASGGMDGQVLLWAVDAGDLAPPLRRLPTEEDDDAVAGDLAAWMRTIPQGAAAAPFAPPPSKTAGRCAGCKELEDARKAVAMQTEELHGVNTALAVTRATLLDAERALLEKDVELQGMAQAVAAAHAAVEEEDVELEEAAASEWAVVESDEGPAAHGACT